MFCKLFRFFLVAFCHGPGGVEYLRIGGDVVLGFLLFFCRFPNIDIFPFKIRNIFFQRIHSAFLGVWI